jgi:hypothetical protein
VCQEIVGREQRQHLAGAHAVAHRVVFEHDARELRTEDLEQAPAWNVVQNI